MKPHSARSQTLKMCVSSVKRSGYMLKRATNLEDKFAKAIGWALMTNPKGSVSGGLTPRPLASNGMSTMTIPAHQLHILRGRMMGENSSKCERTNLLYPSKNLPLLPLKHLNLHLPPKMKSCLSLTLNRGKNAPENHPNESKTFLKAVLNLQRLHGEFNYLHKRLRRRNWQSMWMSIR